MSEPESASMLSGKVPIPLELWESLREVHEIIRAARHDPAIHLDFDDAIQVENLLCGGRSPRDRKRFDLTCYPPGFPHCRWSLTLHRLEIEDIADGVMAEIKLWSCTSPGCDYKSREANNRCAHCGMGPGPAGRSPLTG
jgi:hypothetical protein